tara:strand:- start:3644 stop:3919 length:276 start_codon:yes stop_codon:yes gene_type:complete
MVNLKDIYFAENELNESAATKRDTLKLEMKCNKAIRMMKEIALDFKKIYGVSTSNAVLYNNLKDFEQLARDADGKYGGWFGFAKGNPDYEL